MSEPVWVLVEVIDANGTERNGFKGVFSSFEIALTKSRELVDADIGTVSWQQSHNNPHYFEGSSATDRHYVAWRQNVDEV